MSPSWRSGIDALLQPQRVCVRRYARGLTPRLVAQASAPVAAPTPQAAVEALAGLLQDSGGGALRVTLSSHFVRYALLPPSDLLVSPDDWASFARASFARVHGAAAESWQVAVDRTAAGAAVACGIDAALVEQLRACAKAARASLAALQPALMAVYNELRPQFGTDACRLVIVEPGLATVARIGDGGWLRLRVQRLAGDRDSDRNGNLGADLASLLERERVLDEQPLDPDVAVTVALGLPAGALGGSGVLATSWAPFDDLKQEAA